MEIQIAGSTKDSKILPAATLDMAYCRPKSLAAVADEIKTSDQYLCERVRQADVFEVQFEQRKRLQDRLSGGLAQAADRLLLTWVSRFNNQRFW